MKFAFIKKITIHFFIILAVAFLIALPDADAVTYKLRWSASLDEDDNAAWDSTTIVRNIYNAGTLGKIYGDGEF